MSWRKLWQAIRDGFASFNLNGNVHNPYHFADDTEAIRDDWLKVGQDLANAIDQFGDGNILRPGVICAHCGIQTRGMASIDGQPVCHTDPPFPDCYRLVTVYHEKLGSRRPGGRLVPPDPAECW
jgi:hypothetical protein